MTRFVWTEPAVADLEAIVDFIARDSDVYARVTAERVLAAVDGLAPFLRSGRLGAREMCDPWYSPNYYWNFTPVR